jgi:hypothetical protein
MSRFTRMSSLAASAIVMAARVGLPVHIQFRSPRLGCHARGPLGDGAEVVMPRRSSMRAEHSSSTKRAIASMSSLCRHTEGVRR